MGALHRVLGPFSLILGALTVLALAAAGMLYVLLPELQQASTGMLAVAGVLAVIYVLSSLTGIRDALVGRQTRFGVNTLVMVVAFIGIVSLVNYLGSRIHHRFDTTASGEFTLSLHTQTVLKNLKDPVHVIGFFIEKDPVAMASREQAGDLLKEYSYLSSKLTYEFVDPEEKPAIARQYEIRDYGALVFTVGSKKQQVFGLGEQDFTGAILNITGVQQKKVLFVGGHGEHDIDAEAGDGYRQARQGLETDNYKVDRLDLGTTAKVPEDTAVLVLAGPKKPLLTNELKVIEDYLRQGGKMMVLVEPNPQKELQDLLRKWGVAFREGSVVDTLVYAQPDFATPAVLNTQYRTHQITANLDTTFFPGATGVYFAIPPDDQGKLTPSPLAITSRSSWMTTSSSTSGTPTFAEGKDVPGPMLLAATIEAQAPVGEPVVPGVKPSRLVIVGDSDFASNEYFYSKSNSDLFLNSVNWLGAQEELISIRPKPPQFRRLIITQRGWNWILYSSVGFLPAAVLLAGGVAWWRRR